MEVKTMSNDMNNNPAAEGENNAVQGADAMAGVNVPEDGKNATAGVVGGNAGMYNHKFKKPFEFEGKKYAVLNFDFEKLTGRDMISIENEMQANNEYALDPLLSRNFQSKMASRAAGVGTDMLEALPIQEFNKITNAARNFLISSGY
jgi:hypothetical protein